MKKSLLLLIAALVLPAAGVNIVLNPSFETWLLGVPVGWLTSEALSPGSAVRDSNSHTGSWCVRLEAVDTSAFVTSATLVRPGLSYEFAGWVRSPGAVAGSFILQFTKLDASPIGSPTLIPAYYSGTNYREYRRWVTAPDSSVFLSITFATLAGLVAYVDDVTLDDTSLTAVAERAPVRTERVRGLGKFVSCGSQVPMPAQPVYDALGRRVSQARPGRGVYFLLPK